MSKKKPLYSAIVDDLQKRIAEGEYQPGENLPTESELCEQYNVSRITVRKAISCLEEDGVIDHPFSKTPCVKKSSIPRRINYMRGLSEDLMREGVRCSNYILKAEKMSADEALAEAMKVAVGEPLYYVERLRYGNGEPLCYQSLYLVTRFCPGILDEDLAKESIYALLENKYGMKIDHCVQNITACISSYRICALLELADRTAMLKVTNTGYLQTGECYEYAQNYYVGGTYAISVELSRK